LTPLLLGETKKTPDRYSVVKEHTPNLSGDTLTRSTLSWWR